jgi:hypothetical protein
MGNGLDNKQQNSDPKKNMTQSTWLWTYATAQLNNHRSIFNVLTSCSTHTKKIMYCSLALAAVSAAVVVARAFHLSLTRK